MKHAAGRTASLGGWMRLRSRVRVALLAAVAAAGGCATKPYDRDPLLSNRYGVRGDRTVAARPLPLPVEPASPDAPPDPLLTSR